MVLNIENLTKSYGDTVAVNNLSLAIESGTVFGFIGPNGAGKTTTIKCIAGLLDFEEGNIYIDQEDIKINPRNSKTKIGYVPDTPFMYDKLTGREFLYFVGRLYGIDESKLRARIDEYARLLEFEHYMDIKTDEYSHGMKQRIVIASAFIHDPLLVLIDEPMVGLDPKVARTVKNIFVGHAEKGGSVFVSTHTLSIAEEICNRIGVMNKGKLIYTGGIDNLGRKLKKDNLEDLFLEITKDDRSFIN